MAKRTLSKKEMEEMKKRRDEQAAAEVFQQFVEEFQEDSSKVSKVWVKAGTYDAGARKEDTKDKGKLYKPTSKLASLAETFSSKAKSKEARESKESKEASDKLAKKNDKRRSNLEQFKEELRAMQEEREERHRIKSNLKSSRFDPPSAATPNKSTPSSHGLSLAVSEKGSFDMGDPNTTNIYLGNINPKMTEQQLMDSFGKYGPLASVKVMWPRTEEEKARNRNCGFVAFMCRKDAERAMRKLNGKEILGFEMKLGWGKALPIPTRPIFVPPVLLETTLPPPPTGLPFNALPAQDDIEKIPPPGTPYPTQGDALRNFNKILSRAVVKVVIPTERNLLCLIHRMIEFVVREGPMFEAMMMNKEIDNPQFRFLFENRSPAHIYYRWKLFSILQGEAANKWRAEDFRMFKNGSTWRPPSVNPFAQGMPDDMFSSDEEDYESRRRSLSKSQKKRLELMLRKLTPERTKVTEAMIFCIEHAEASDEIVDFIVESLNSSKTALAKKLGRFFLLSDVLYNSSAKAINASNFRSGFQNRLVDVTCYMRQTVESTESRLKAEAFKQRVMVCFRAWQEWNVYPPDFLVHLQNIFLGLASEMPKSSRGVDEDVDGVPLEEDADLDGAPLSDSEDLDGVPLDGAALLRSAVKLSSGSLTPPPPSARPAASHKMSKYDDDVDGVPMSEDIDGIPLEAASPPSGVFRSKRSAPVAQLAASKWESISSAKKSAPSQPVAMATSKWDHPDGAEYESQPPARKKAAASRHQREDIFIDADASSRSRRLTSDDDDDVAGGNGKRGDHEEDLDGTALDDSSQDATRHSTDSRSEDRRGKLREIELKVVRYQDEIESGIQSRISGMSVSEQIQQYRQDLMRKVMRSHSDERRDSRERDWELSRRERRDPVKSERSSTSAKEKESRHRDKERRGAVSRSRSRSRSPKKSSRSKRARSRSRSRSSSPERSSRRSPRRYK